MAGRNSDLGQVAAVGAHRLGGMRDEGLADIVVGAMQKEHGDVESPLCFGALGVGEVGLPVHVPAVGAEEPVALERGDIAMLVLLAEHGGVARNVRRPIGGVKPAAVDAGEGSPRGLASTSRIAGSEKRPNGSGHVALEAWLREGEIL